MKKQFKFTRSNVGKLSLPTKRKRVYYKDTGHSKLLLQVTASGTKSFYFRYFDRSTDYTTKIFIGKYPDVLPDEARKRAFELSSDLAKGIDPAAKRRELRAEIAFGEAYALCIQKPRRKRPRRTATLRNYENIYRKYLAPRFAKRRISTFTRADIELLHEEIGEQSGTYAANRAVKLVSCVFNDSIARGWEGLNPCLGIEYFPETSRTRFLEEDELASFIRTCEQVAGRINNALIAEYLVFALFTGVRRSNACAARWDQMNFQRRTWDIPGDLWKNGNPHRVYLCDYLLRRLESRYEQRESSIYVFPSHSRTGHLVEPKKGLAKIVEQAEIKPQGVNVHCLRHTFLTYADDFGLPSAARKRLAGHTVKQDVIDGYTHALERRVRESYENVALHMLSIARQTESTSISVGSAA